MDNGDIVIDVLGHVVAADTCWDGSRPQVGMRIAAIRSYRDTRVNTQGGSLKGRIPGFADLTWQK